MSSVSEARRADDFRGLDSEARDFRAAQHARDLTMKRSDERTNLGEVIGRRMRKHMLRYARRRRRRNMGIGGREILGLARADKRSESVAEEVAAIHNLAQNRIQAEEKYFRP